MPNYTGIVNEASRQLQWIYKRTILTMLLAQINFAPSKFNYQSRNTKPIIQGKMKQPILVSILLGAIISGYHCAVVEPRAHQTLTKVFNYQGNLPPIKDDRTGEIIKDDTIEATTTTTNSTSEAEKLCWDLIVEQTDVTFALQKRVLDELNKDLKDLPMSDRLRAAIDGLTKKLRSDMEDALNALKEELPEEYFDALFDTSEDIVHMSHLIRDPKLDERVFLVLVKAVSRLGRNNSSLIQDFIDQCSVVNKSPRPRSLFSF